MKLTEWRDEDRIGGRIVAYLTGRLEDLGATEDATLVIGSGTDGRTLVATTVGLFDGAYVMPTGGDHAPDYVVRLRSWDSVPAPTVSFVALISSGSWGTHPGEVQVRLDLDPPCEGTYRGRDRDRAAAFVRAVTLRRSDNDGQTGVLRGS